MKDPRIDLIAKYLYNQINYGILNPESENFNANQASVEIIEIANKKFCAECEAEMIYKETQLQCTNCDNWVYP